MRYTAALLFVLSWIPVQAQKVDNIGRLANALSIDAECTWLPNDKGDYIFDCGEYHDFTLFKMQVGGFINRYGDIQQTLPWTLIDDGQYVMTFKYEDDEYLVVYVSDYRSFVIAKLEE